MTAIPVVPGTFLDIIQDAALHLWIHKWPWNFFSWQKKNLAFLISNIKK